ncbi:class I SAM-dependent methyltransferase [Alienimonas chondri]|uniref:Ubiquinone biosynthesis O-methyltransferase n=1 Tax=Alienimonas chondri TaxID=2681879 RepID=A0ABX1VES2_9PLAN|nr:class I SAM-dependent methyltransferase [Alienimonas chondri]NNJ26385.1 Ubiquinone biosynthesis O-methyltransferase [Alienimonas chondri]
MCVSAGSGPCADPAAGVDVAGVDLSESGIALARRTHPGVGFEVASVTDNLTSLFERRFDAVTSLEVVEHLYDPRAYVAALFDVLEPGGTVIMTTPYHGYLTNPALAAAGQLDDHFTVLWDGGHIKFWLRRTLSVLLTEAGFEDVRFRGGGRLPWLWKSMILSARKPA